MPTPMCPGVNVHMHKNRQNRDPNLKEQERNASANSPISQGSLKPNVCCDLRNDFDVFLPMKDVVNEFVEDNFLGKMNKTTISNTLCREEI